MGSKIWKIWVNVDEEIGVGPTKLITKSALADAQVHLRIGVAVRRKR